jgi:VanZ family protein
MKHWVGVAFWLVLVFGLSSIPGPLVSQLEPIHQDKILHGSAYLIGGLLIGLALRASFPRLGNRTLVYTILGIGLIGILDETYQILTPGRSGLDPFDWLADVSGGCLAVIILFLVGLYGRYRKSQAPD